MLMVDGNKLRRRTTFARQFGNGFLIEANLRAGRKKDIFDTGQCHCRHDGFADIARWDIRPG
jgi:hypothetical protein